ncbi:hypothetical protein GOODEAATRI_025911, partial [Goodea atripinnis]
APLTETYPHLSGPHLSYVRGTSSHWPAACFVFLSGRSDAFRSGSDDFVLDAKDAVERGAALLSTHNVSVNKDCETFCCRDPRCNLALLEPRDAKGTADTRTCVLFDCVHKKRFVCRFVNQDGYHSYMRERMFQRYLQAPGRDVVVQPGEIVTLNGTESVALHAAHIVDYRWSLQSGDPSLKMEDQVRLPNLHPGSYVLKLSVKDSNGQSGDDEVTVLVLSSELSSCECSWEISSWSSSARCVEPPLTGPCRASFTRWYYDPTDRKCQRFTFGSIALAAFLAVAILALLAILGYCFLRGRRKRSSNPHALPHVALPEQDTLVYNSTTKPA